MQVRYSKILINKCFNQNKLLDLVNNLVTNLVLHLGKHLLSFTAKIYYGLEGIFNINLLY